jgi:hypothetical protein
MTNLAIGLCVGLAAAVALVIMWRMAERLRKEAEIRANQPHELERSDRDGALEDEVGGG